jgi:hypothetical protein
MRDATDHFPMEALDTAQRRAAAMSPCRAFAISTA